MIQGLVPAVGVKLTQRVRGSDLAMEFPIAQRGPLLNLKERVSDPAAVCLTAADTFHLL